MSDQKIPVPASGNRYPDLRNEAPFNGFAGGSRYADFAHAGEESSFDPLRLLYYVIENRWLIAALLAISLVGGFLVTKAQTPLYRSTSRLEVLVPPARVFQDIQVVSEWGDMRTFYTTRERLRSRAVAEHVVLSLGLADNTAFLFPPEGFGITNILRRAFHTAPSVNLDEYPPDRREMIAIGRVLGNMTADPVRDTNIISISFRDSDPVMAQRVANQIAQSYIDQRVDQIGATSELARQFIEDQVAQIKDRLQASERALVDYAKTAGIAVTGSDQSLIDSSIQAINNALSATVEERMKYEVLAKQIERGLSGGLEQVMQSEGLQSLRGQIASLNAEYQQKLRVYKPGFPEMQQLQAQMQEMRKQYDGGVAAIVEGIHLRLDEARIREADLTQQLVKLQADQVAFQDKNIQYTILKREVDSNRSQFDSLIAKLNDVGIASELRNKNAEIVDFAGLPGAPVSPNLRLNVGLAALLALAASAAIIYVRELLNNTFVSPDQVEKTLSLPVIGILPYVDDELRAKSVVDPKSKLSEAYRSLRTSIQFSSPDGAIGALLVTSSEPFEGKSTTIFKLAQDLAQLGKKVIVIDGDLRKPKIHRFFGLDNTLGLSDILVNVDGNDKLGHLIRQTGVENVWAITSGTIPPNPADLIASQRMAALIDSLLQRFDAVLIDAPPVLGLADAPILARLARSTLLIVSTGQVTQKSALGALKRLRAAGANVIGAAMSKFSVSKFDYSYSYNYMTENYYNYGQESLQLEADNEGSRPGKSRRNRFLRNLVRGRSAAGGSRRNRGEPAP